MTAEDQERQRRKVQQQLDDALAESFPAWSIGKSRLRLDWASVFRTVATVP